LKFIQGVCPVFQEVGYVIFVVKTLKPHDEWMFGVFGQFDACLLLVILQGSVEEHPEASSFWLLSHLKDMEEIESLGVGLVHWEEMMARRETVGMRRVEGWPYYRHRWIYRLCTYVQYSHREALEIEWRNDVA